MTVLTVKNRGGTFKLLLISNVINPKEEGIDR